MDFNNRTKNLVRAKILSLAQEPIRNGIVLPSAKCEDIKAAQRFQLVDGQSTFIAYEENKDIRKVMKETLDGLGIVYEDHARLETFNLGQILKGKKSNFVNLDLCGMLTAQIFNWLYFNFKADGKNWLTDNAFVSVNMKVTPRTSRPAYLTDELYEPDSKLIKIARGLTKDEEFNSSMIFSTLRHLMPWNIFHSDEIIYQSDGAMTTMITSTFLLEA
jgi:hypothetical protein